MQRKLLVIINVDFDATGQLLIMYSAFFRYLGKNGENNKAMHQLFIDSKKAYDSFRREVFYNIPYPTAFLYGNGMVLHFYQQQESSTTKTVHKVINKGLKTCV